MAAGTKLPMPLQLVGVTAVLVFATSTVSLTPLAVSLAKNWHALGGLLRAWSGYYDLVFISLALDALLVVASASMFVALLYAPHRVLPRLAIAYIAVVALILAWRIYIHFPNGGIHGLRALAASAQLYFWLRILCVVWLAWLANAVMPNYSFKRTGAERLR